MRDHANSALSLRRTQLLAEIGEQREKLGQTLDQFRIAAASAQSLYQQSRKTLHPWAFAIGATVLIWALSKRQCVITSRTSEIARGLWRGFEAGLQLSRAASQNPRTRNNDR